MAVCEREECNRGKVMILLIEMSERKKHMMTSTTKVLAPSSGIYANCVWTPSFLKNEAVLPCVLGKEPYDCTSGCKYESIIHASSALTHIRSKRNTHSG